ncbi:mechanosensitive ion channel-like protein [Nonlabens dokdonensis]|uniref:Small conductance mechanosensitive channel n=2 Tax=Nonlabens dokdonensis TaxID=328515 RepID=L7WBH3_NONDD|nr:mechanosensitive ion channel domain-containing protein [Nonlabens dokdonensis]AGC77454.1 small conductance mechanosensitive channel [Nonlabens dokdonensis DSW-6]PZX40977.1 mechanosensitive ion channel-like protein [Nonlabens dokdonensis]
MNIDWDKIQDFLTYEIIPSGKNGGFHFDTWMLILAIIAILVTTLILRGIKKVITRKMEDSDKLKFESVFKFFNYLVYIIVVITVLHSSGVQLTGLLTASAALFVGLGFALQDLFKDIIAGVTILIDKSVLVNDVIEMNNKVGRVFEVKLRSTRIITRDDKILIIPNHLFMSESVYNYTQNHPKTRESVLVGVAYGSDTELVARVLKQCAIDQKGILKSPEPFVMFNDFADSSLNFGVYYFIKDAFNDPRIKSALRFAIDKAFRENNVTIPFPQRDLHIITNKSDQIIHEKTNE